MGKPVLCTVIYITNYKVDNQTFTSNIETALKQPLNIDSTKSLKTGGILTQDNNIAECTWSILDFCNTFDLH